MEGLCSVILGVSLALSAGDGATDAPPSSSRSDTPAAEVSLRAELAPAPAYSSSRALEPAVVSPAIIEPVAPQPTPQEEWQAHRKRQWIVLTAAQHGAATFDAWTTRRSVRAGAHELNPLLRPVAGSNALHAVIQLTPLLTDYFGRRMAVSEKRWLRRAWWLPQAVSTGVHLGAGINNLGTYKQVQQSPVAPR